MSYEIYANKRKKLFQKGQNKDHGNHFMKYMASTGKIEKRCKLSIMEIMLTGTGCAEISVLSCDDPRTHFQA